MREDADEYTVARHLEAYLLWVFGWVLFTSTHGNSVRKDMIHYARAIADAPLGQVPQYSWGNAVLGATYRGLCEGCVKVDPTAVFTGCPLLVQLWSYERFQVGQPAMDHSSYGHALYYPDEVDRPTMGTLWCRRRVSYFS
jgi:hypothetical protein